MFHFPAVGLPPPHPPPTGRKQDFGLDDSGWIGYHPTQPLTQEKYYTKSYIYISVEII
jgi:hypothetical protein